MLSKIEKIIAESIAVKQEVLQNASLHATVAEVAAQCISCFQKQGKVLFCGNGGSAADAQHLAAELSGRFYLDRAPLFAEALHVNSSFLTAVANDYGFDQAFARMVDAMGKPGDILFAISTSGNSPNILKAVEAALHKGMVVVGMTGKSGGVLGTNCHYLLNVPSNDTPRIQECHILLGHILCELIENGVFSK